MEYDIETRCIHGKNEKAKEHGYGSLSTPIYQTATFAHPGVGHSTGYDYSRESNPTRSELEEIVSSLEGCLDTVACGNGMAALSICMELFASGDHFVCTEDLYGGSVRYFNTIGTKRGLSYSYVNTADPSAVEDAIQENTKALYIETPSNPTMQVTDLRAMKELARRHGLLLIVDNTFLSPYFQRPFRLGADLVIHSGTKFLSGHNDTLAGFLCCNDAKIAEKIRYIYKTVGSALAPMDSFLLIRGIKTLAIRMERQQENAGKIARWLQRQKKVKKVFYVGLPDHPGYEINQKQTSGNGSMISFEVDKKETAIHLLEHVKLISYAESLGGVETLVTYPMLQTHGDVPAPVRERLGITDVFLRLSVGIEHAEDLIADLDQALNGEE